MIFSIIGPNGAGKTTLFNLISGIYRAADGTIMVDGLDVTGLRPADAGPASACRAPSRTCSSSPA